MIRETAQFHHTRMDALVIKHLIQTNMSLVKISPLSENDYVEEMENSKFENPEIAIGAEPYFTETENTCR